MTGVVTRSNFPRLLLGSISEIYGLKYAQLPAIYKEVFDVISSSRAYEEYVELSGLGMASVKQEGAILQEDSMKQGLTTKISNVTYGKMMAITMEAMRDNQYGASILRMAPELAKSVRHAEETAAANVLNLAFDTSQLMADGVVVCSTAHLNSRDGSTFANRPSAAVDLSEAALEQAVIDIYGMTGPDGLRIEVTPEKLVIPRQLIFEAHRILKSTLRVGTADNDANALKDMGMLQTVIPWRFLTDTDAWFIKTNVERALVFQDRSAAEFDTDNDFVTKNVLYSVHRRFGIGAVDAHGLYGSPGA